MNSALRQTARFAGRNTGRFQSTKATATPEISTTFLTLGKKHTTASTWLSDPSTYPLLICLGAAAGLCVGVGGWYLVACKDVQINTTKRNSIIRNWGN